MMREKDAETGDRAGQREHRLRSVHLQPGARQAGRQLYVYDRNPKYVPRTEPASGLAGGKVVKVDRVIWENIGDEQTAMAALQAGEIDFYETPPLDLSASSNPTRTSRSIC